MGFDATRVELYLAHTVLQGIFDYTMAKNRIILVCSVAATARIALIGPCHTKKNKTNLSIIVKCVVKAPT